MKFNKFTLITLILSLFTAHAFGMKRLVRAFRKNSAHKARIAPRAAGNMKDRQIAPQAETPSNRTALSSRFRNYLFGTGPSETTNNTFVVRTEASTPNSTGRVNRGTGRTRVFSKQQNNPTPPQKYDSTDAKEVASPEEVLVQEEARLFENIDRWNQEPAPNQSLSRPTFFGRIKTWLTGESQPTTNNTFVINSSKTTEQAPAIRTQRTAPRRDKGKEKVHPKTNKVLEEEKVRLQRNFEKWDEESLAEKHAQQNEKLAEQIKKRGQVLNAKQKFQTSIAQAKRVRLERETKARSKTMREATKRNMDSLIKEQEQKIEQMRLKHEQEKVQLAQEERIRKAKLLERQKQQHIKEQKQERARMEAEKKRMQEHSRLEREAAEAREREAQRILARTTEEQARVEKEFREVQNHEKKRMASEDTAARERVIREVKQREAFEQNRMASEESRARDIQRKMKQQKQQQQITGAVRAIEAEQLQQEDSAIRPNQDPQNDPIAHMNRQIEKKQIDCDELLNEYDKLLKAFLQKYGQMVLTHIRENRPLPLEWAAGLEPIQLLFSLYNDYRHSNNTVAPTLANDILTHAKRLKVRL